jgi:hypothetical protein
MIEFSYSLPRGDYDQLTEGQKSSAIGKFSRALKNSLRDFTPVDTGLLKSNWSVAVDPASLECMIRNPTPYAIYVDMGTRRMRARSMVAQAIATSTPLWEMLVTASAQSNVNRQLNQSSRADERFGSARRLAENLVAGVSLEDTRGLFQTGDRVLLSRQRAGVDQTPEFPIRAVLQELYGVRGQVVGDGLGVVTQGDIAALRRELGL